MAFIDRPGLAQMLLQICKQLVHFRMERLDVSGLGGCQCTPASQASCIELLVKFKIGQCWHDAIVAGVTTPIHVAQWRA